MYAPICEFFHIVKLMCVCVLMHFGVSVFVCVGVWVCRGVCVCVCANVCFCSSVFAQYPSAAKPSINLSTPQPTISPFLLTLAFLQSFPFISHLHPSPTPRTRSLILLYPCHLLTVPFSALSDQFAAVGQNTCMCTKLVHQA